MGILLCAGRALAANSMKCGETFEGKIGPFVTDEIQFEANVGEVVSITAAAEPDPQDPLYVVLWAIKSPRGINEVYLNDGSVVCADMQCETAPLPTNGTYRIQVFGVSVSSRVYRLTLEAVSWTANGKPNTPPEPTCARAPLEGTQPLEREKPFVAAIEPEGETDTFTFFAKLGEVLSIDVEPLNQEQTAAALPSFVPQWELFDAKGRRVPTADQESSCVGACATSPLSGGESFTVKVSTPLHVGHGAYSILLSGKLPPTTTTTSITTTTTFAEPTTTTFPSPVCGNGLLEEGEECDPPGEATCPSDSSGGAFTACLEGCICARIVTTTTTAPETTTTTSTPETTTTLAETTTTIVATTTTVEATTSTVVTTTTTTDATRVRQRRARAG